MEANNRFSQTIGVNWGGAYDSKSAITNKTMPSNLFDPNNSTAYGGNTMLPNEVFGAIDVVGGASTLGVGFLNRAGTLALSAELTANETMGLSRVISAPRIMASNDQEVYIKQGTQIPYSSGSSASTAANTEFKDAVMELRVTPHIEENGQIVSLDITLTKDTPGPSSVPGGEPTIETKEAKTKLMVKDGETVVIGGILEDSQANTSNRVPGIHRVPLTNSKTELLIFITANILPLSI